MSELAPPLLKYPRTPHLRGSLVALNDDERESLDFDLLADRHLVVEEKLDGANAALRFDASGRLWLQSRGHFLLGGPRERHFDLFKRWASSHQRQLYAVLGSRYVVYGEWLYAKHTLFYDALPHYFVEFDVLDLHDEFFLSTARRQALLPGLPIVSAPVLWQGPGSALEHPPTLIGPSQFKSADWRRNLADRCEALGLDQTRVERETDPSDMMEGLYIKVESEEHVLERYKFVRGSFLAAVLDSESHWLDRPIVPNRLREGVDLFGTEG